LTPSHPARILRHLILGKACSMHGISTRRSMLQMLGGVGAVAAGLAPLAGRAAVLQAPVVDKLTMTVLVDAAFDNFLRPSKLQGITVESGRRLPDYRRALHNEWGLSLWLESQQGAQVRNVMLDYG
jgi:7,8-dihydropterin-6-yl-methyl-4-(beta-D-ribofuranosyl)aminobenzene 5'-phosphate synthase